MHGTERGRNCWGKSRWLVAGLDEEEKRKDGIDSRHGVQACSDRKWHGKVVGVAARFERIK